MKTRREPCGLHFFDRVSGLHILLDELQYPSDEWSRLPRTVSIALTNVCDLKCHFCYAPKSKDSLPFEYVKKLTTKLDELGVFEITLGGGEPLLYPEIDKLCDWIWNNTNLGISITTHGHHLTENLIDKLQSNISTLRFSIDGIEPYYSEIRNRPLSRLIDTIEKVRGKIPFGFNITVSPNKTDQLERVIELAISCGAINALIIPLHDKGKFILNENDWREIDRIINSYQKDIQLLVTFDAANYLNSNTLLTETSEDFLFAHISADNRLKNNSYSVNGDLIDNLDVLEYLFEKINPQTLKEISK